MQYKTGTVKRKRRRARNTSVSAAKVSSKGPIYIMEKGRFITTKNATQCPEAL